MAIDTQAKRASVLYIVQPDGTIAQADRQTLLEVYGGILAAEAVTATPEIVLFSGSIDRQLDLSGGIDRQLDITGSIARTVSLSGQLRG